MATFTRDQLDELDLPDNLSDTEVIDEGRWSLTKTGIADFNGRHYRFEFEEPATEMQEGLDPWNDADQVEAVEVRQEQVVVTKWIPVDQIGH